MRLVKRPENWNTSVRSTASPRRYGCHMAALRGMQSRRQESYYSSHFHLLAVCFWTDDLSCVCTFLWHSVCGRDTCLPHQTPWSFFSAIPALALLIIICFCSSSRIRAFVGFFVTILRFKSVFIFKRCNSSFSYSLSVSSLFSLKRPSAMIVVLLSLKLLGLLFLSVSGPPSVAALCVFGTRWTDWWYLNTRCLKDRVSGKASCVLWVSLEGCIWEGSPYQLYMNFNSCRNVMFSAASSFPPPKLHVYPLPRLFVTYNYFVLNFVFFWK